MQPNRVPTASDASDAPEAYDASADRPNTHDPPPTGLVAAEAEQLLVQLISQDVTNAVNTAALSEIERRLAVELARLGEPSDARLLAIPRALIARALRQLADDRAAGHRPDDTDLDIRYDNAICREVVAALDAATSDSTR